MSKYLPLCCDEVQMRTAAAKICRDYLHGAWKTVSPQDLIFKRISGGLSNFLYYVALPEKATATHSSDSKAPPLSVDDNSPEASDDDKEKNSTIRKLLGRSFSRQASFLTEEPQKVLVRIYGQTQSERGVDNIIMDSVIFTLLSERRLGPRLHGVFSGGRIEEFIPARQLTIRELGEPAFSMKIAEKMAAIHTMDVPLCKEPQWLWKKISKWHEKAVMNLERNNKNEREAEVINKLKKYNFEKEISWLKNFLNSINSPVVFCHNDLQEGNILLKEEILPQNDDTNDDVNVDYSTMYHDSSSDSCLSGTTKDTFIDESRSVGAGTQCDSDSAMDVSQSENTNKEIETRSSKKRKTSINMDEDCNTIDSICSHTSDGSLGNGEPKLVLIDYEYCSYNHRGFDLANHFIEWAYEYTNPDYPYYYEKFDQYPSLEQKEIFMKQYLLKVNRDQVPSLEELNHLNLEVESFTLASHMFWSLWGIVNAPDSQIPFGYWEYALSRIEWYYRLKQDIVKKDDSVSSLKRKIREVDI
ncbi:choline/ethanolamine kinase isoform X2 [Arctopsyche grandis]|uniref:choline/ethanolamine kinase isoform X2 n=1 Tax=Arctopsyche grandis TaxID=121162 RepID=UPI00406D6D97